MIIKTIVRKNEYYNSVFLMRISEKTGTIRGVKQGVVLMATELNKEMLAFMGLITEGVRGADASDFVIALQTETNDDMQNAINEIEKMLRIKQVEASSEYFPKTFNSALEIMPDANLAVISVPGEFAKREALKVLESGLHVMVFSSNMSTTDEKDLKQFARSKGLLMMGPDCGTAIINGAVLGFGNVIRKGTIGIIAASGTGIQQVSAIIHRLDSGISQALGTGGRDLFAEIGGIATLECLKFLEQDEDTGIILLISKPPSPQVSENVLAAARKCRKPVIVCFLGMATSVIEAAGLISAVTLEDAAKKAVVLAKGVTSEKVIFTPPEQDILSVVGREYEKLASEQQYIRGLFSGGTLCYESILMLKELVGDVYSNAPIKHDLKLSDPHWSRFHSCVDMGSEDFVVGRPHPMIDPTMRKQRFIREAGDSETGVILMDIVLGYGSHPDPAGVMVPVIAEARKEAERRGRYLPVVASVIGTELDTQNLNEQEKKLKEVGVIVLPSNAQATRMAALIVTRGKLQEKLF